MDPRVMKTPEEEVGRFDRLFWLLSVVCFAGGFYVGMNVHAQFGAFLWAASGLFALLPFASHRHRL